MTTLDFPASPSSGALHNAANGITYNFDGVKWTSVGQYPTGVADVLKLDDISSSFNGSNTTFDLKNGGVSVAPGSPQAILVSVGGVVQEPTTAYTVSATAKTITFTEAPATGLDFWGIMYTRIPQSTGIAKASSIVDGGVDSAAIADGSITNVHVNNSAAIASSKLSFTQTGTGASARTIDSKLKDFVSVKDFGATGDGSTDDRAAIQAAIDSVNTGGTLYFPPGTYYVDETTTIGGTTAVGSLIKDTVGSQDDAPDFICLKLLSSKNLNIIGHGAKIEHDRGYAFFGLLCENVRIKGIHFKCKNTQLSGYSAPSGFEPEAVCFNYSMNCHVEECLIEQEHRGLSFRRTAGCSAKNNTVTENYYISIASYGDFFQSGSWIGAALTERFEQTGHSTDTGIVFDGNRISDYNYFGIYSNGPALITNNRIESPLTNTEWTATTIVGGQNGVLMGGGQCVVADNKFYSSGATDIRAASSALKCACIAYKLEDVADGSFASETIISGNYCEGHYYGFTATEIENVIITNNIFKNYTGAAINIVGASALGSNAKAVTITDNIIGQVDSATLATSATYESIGGIVFSLTGSGWFIDKVNISRNIFNRKWNEIANGTAKTAAKWAIYMYQSEGSAYAREVYVRDNILNAQKDGEVMIANWYNENSFIQEVNGTESIDDFAGTYAKTGGDQTLTITHTGHNYVVGDKVDLTLTGLTDQVNQPVATVVSDDVFTVEHTTGGESGTAVGAGAAVTIHPREKTLQNGNIDRNFVINVAKAVTLFLPKEPVPGVVYRFKNRSGNTLSVDGVNATSLVDNSASAKTVADGNALTIVCMQHSAADEKVRWESF